MHLKVLSIRKALGNIEDRERADALQVELASLNGLCTFGKDFLLHYLGFQELSFDDDDVLHTVIVSDYIHGDSFGSWNGRIQPFLNRLIVMNQLASALSFMHEGGYCHNDLSPNNFIVIDDQHGNVSTVLIDFGSTRPPGV